MAPSHTVKRRVDRVKGEEVRKVYRHTTIWLVRRLVVCVAIAAALVAAASAAGTAAFAALALIPILVGVLWYHHWLNRQFVVTNARCFKCGGAFDTDRFGSFWPVDDLQLTSVNNIDENLAGFWTIFGERNYNLQGGSEKSGITLKGYPRGITDAVRATQAARGLGVHSGTHSADSVHNNPDALGR